LKIDKIQLRKFRNLKKVNYEPSAGLNVLVGNNAQGKTNLLESIFVMATGSSFRTSTDSNLVNYDEDVYFIKSIYIVSERIIEASLSYNLNGTKKFLIKNQKNC